MFDVVDNDDNVLLFLKWVDNVDISMIAINDDDDDDDDAGSFVYYCKILTNEYNQLICH